MDRRSRELLTPDRWKQVEAVFEQALERPPAARPQFLQETCNGDDELRREVESLLESHRQAGTFIDQPTLFFSHATFDANAPSVEAGRVIGPYRVVREIGRGGMGAVYLAERADEQYQKQVAIKLIKRGMDTEAVLRHFRRERQILAGFDHPNIARLFDAGTTPDGLPYFVMEYIDGLPIDKYCQAHNLAVPKRLKLFREVCAAVSYAHRRGVIHRDIKPSNIVVTSEGMLKLLDFGIAKMLQPAAGTESLLTVTGLRPMTPHYASPEQVRGDAITPTSDVYSLGVVLYELLTGTSPYEFTSHAPRDVERAISEQEPTRPSTALRQCGSTDSRFTNYDSRALRGDLDNILLTALRKEPERRYQSVDEFSEDIRRHLENRPVRARKDAFGYRARKFLRRNPSVAIAAACLLLALAVIWLANTGWLRTRMPALEKSVAVLPFANLSDDSANAFFTGGVQDEILSNLAKVADLKVISRTSVMQYKDVTKRNLRTIAQQLGVANVVEGSVQRAGNRVRVNAQLIDARTDRHLWAQTYDADLTDVFGIQTQIARAIADQLQATLSAREKAAIAQVPTTNLAAYELYRRALPLEHAQPAHQNLLEGIRLLEKAVQLDPNFLLAYCALTRMHLTLYSYGYDHTPARRDLANMALQNAQRVHPDGGEVHLERGGYWFVGFKDYDRGRAELELARRALPNNPKIYFLTGLMDHRQARWAEGTRNLERAVELDPRDVENLLRTAHHYQGLHQYAEAARMFERAVAVSPHDYGARIGRASVPLSEKADLRPLRAEIDAILKEEPQAAPKIAETLYTCGLYERDRAATDQALGALPPEGIPLGVTSFLRPREWYIGYTARTFGDAEGARVAFTAARAKVEQIVQAQPDYAAAWSLLGRIDAALGRKEDAIREGKRGCELLPMSKDTWEGPRQVRDLAEICAWTGEKDLAFEYLERAGRIPGPDYGELKLDPDWDPLRGDPRFDKFVASFAPKQ